MVHTAKLIERDLERLLAAINCSPPNTTLAWLRGYKAGPLLNSSTHRASMVCKLQNVHPHGPLCASWCQGSQTPTLPRQMHLVSECSS